MQDSWSVPELWPGGTCYIIGGGPGVAAVDPKRLEGARVIVTNSAFKLFPSADALYFMDWMWYKWNAEALLKFNGVKVTIVENCRGKPGIKVLQRGQRNGLDAKPTHISRGACSGYGAMALAVKFGVAKVYLMGFDMRVVNGRHNYHTEHKREVKPDIYETQFLRPFKEAAPLLEQAGVEVLNATPGSAMKVFPIVELEDAYPRS